MATLGEVYAALPAYRAELQQATLDADVPQALAAQPFRGASSAFATPLNNVHATGVGVRVRDGKILVNDFVIKVYVFEKLDLGRNTPAVTRRFGDVEVDVEQLPVQLALARAQRKTRAKRPRAAAAAAVPNRRRFRPIPGGVSIAPIDETFVGTLGCFVRRRAGGAQQIFALSNNHVLVDTNRLPPGTQIVQPGPETGPTNPANVFAALSEFIPIRFPSARFNRETNRFDAAIARVTDLRLIRQGAMLNIANYRPVIAVPQPGMAVIKSGRTTGVTRGRVTAVGVNGVQVNYGTLIR